jgi:hypothetical protein
MKSTVLARIRLPFALVTRIDLLGAEVRAILRKRVPRARMIRALVTLALEHALAPELAPIVQADNVRQGRERRSP